MTADDNNSKLDDLFKSSGVKFGDSVIIETVDATHLGILIQRYEYADRNHLVLKLKNGYNIGINLRKIKNIKKITEKLDTAINHGTDHTVNGFIAYQEPVKDISNAPMPRLSLLSTGGTISSKIDYRTGGVMPALTAKELNDSIPELEKIANIDPEVVMSEYSENIKPEHWSIIASKVASKILLGKYDGIIVSHGTDTMHYTSAALSFALQNLPIPVLIVGAQRSSDRPSSDASLNLIGACNFAAKSKFSGVFVAMHYSISDDVIACHIGTRVRKNHTSRRDAFHSIDVSPFSLIKKDQVEISKQYVDLIIQERHNNVESMIVKPDFENKVSLLKFYPGFDCSMIDYCIELGHKAIILEGTGLGHVNKECFSKIQNAVNEGILIFMTSQC